MTQEVIDVGVNADSGDGDSLYVSGNKINSNFDDFFDLVPVKADIKFFGNNITSRLSNADIDIHPSGTGSILFPGIRFNDNNIEAINTNDDLRISASGSGRVVIDGIGIGGTTLSSSDSTSININENLIVDGDANFGGTFSFSGAQTFPTGSTFGSLLFENGSITDSSGAISFGNENLTTTGTIVFGTGSVIGTLTLADGSITDSSGDISFGNENVTTTGTITAATSSTFGDLTLANGSITSSGGTISFGNENLTTTATSIAINSTLTVANGSITDSGGTISFGNENVTTTGTIVRATGSTIGNLTFANGSITDSGGTISFGNENLTTTASSMAINSTLTAGSGSITDSTGAFSFGNDNVSTTGTLTVDSATTMANMAVSGATSFAAPVTVDNLTFNDNIISTSSNADLILTPGGTGVVNVSNLTIDSSMNFTDNVIKVTTSNADLILSANGTGSVEINGIDLDSGTIDNVVIGANEPSTGLFEPLNYDTLVIPTKLTFSGNTLSTSRTNDNLEFEAHGSGNVIVNGLSVPNADGQTGQFLQTDGSGALSFVGVSIALGVSEIQDARNTIGFSSKTLIDANTAVGAHESILADNSVIDEFSQSKYDSAWYLVLNRLEAADSAIEYQLQKQVTAQGTDDGSTFGSFGGASQIVRTSNNDELTLSTDVREATGSIRLLGAGATLADGSTTSLINAVSYFRIGLGDDDSSGTQAGSGLAQTKLVADLDSAAATLDSWAIEDHRGAKYFISINNTTTNEVSSTEVMLIHDSSKAYITEYNTIVSNAESTPLATFTADISGGNARLRGANGTDGTCRVTMYRILISDDDSASDGTYVDVLGATTVTNTADTTIDANTFRGTSSADVTTQKVITSFSTAFDSVWYHTISKDVTNSEFGWNKLSVNHGTGSDGSTQDAFVSDSSVLTTGAMNDINSIAVAINGSIVEVKATGNNDGSTVINNATSYFAIGLGDNTADATSGNITTEAGVRLAGDTEVAIDHVTASGTTQGLLAATRTGNSFTAGTFDSAWYHVITRDLANGSFETQKLSIVHDLQDAFLSSSSVNRTDVADAHPTYDADIVTAGDSTSKIRLRITDGDGSTVGPSNTMAYYRIGLGDDDSTGYANNETDEISVNKATLSSTLANVDTFAANANTAAKYYISMNNMATGETGNMEALVTHDNTNAYITTYNDVFSGGNSLVTFTADIDSGNVRLRGSANAGASTRVTVYRILLGDTEGAETGTNTKTIANVTVSSSATQIDTWEDTATDAAHYIVSGQNGADEKFVCELTVVTDGAAVFVSQGPNVSTKGTDMLSFTATHDGSNSVVLNALSTSGDSTLVNAYRMILKAPAVVTSTVDSWAKADYRGAKYYMSVKDAGNGNTSNIEAMVVHDGTTAFITSFGDMGFVDLMTLTADMVGNNIVVTATPVVADSVIKFYRILLADDESDTTGTDANTIGAVTVSSSATTLDTFEDTEYTGGHYIIVGFNNGEGSASIMEASVLSNGSEAFISEAGYVSSKGTPQLTLSAAHNGSSTITLSAQSTSGSSTTVNAYRIHMLVQDSFPFTELDSFAHSTSQAANYIITTKDASNRVQMSDIMLVSDGTDSYMTEIDINSESSSAPVMTYTTVVDGANVKLRAESTVENTDSITNIFKIPLSRAVGAPTNVSTLDSFSASTYRSAAYVFSISDSGTGDRGLYETGEIRITHDGTTAYMSVFGRTTNSTGDLVAFSTDITGGNVRLRGTISSTNTHEVTVVRRLMVV